MRPGPGNTRMLTNRAFAYDPTSGKDWRITINLPPEVAQELIPKLREIHPRLAAAGLINAVVEHLILTGDQPLDWPRTVELVQAKLEVVAPKKKPRKPRKRKPAPQVELQEALATD
ncbi:hypothetical protein [Streptomyces sp. NRRL S-87]|uniref:hypothetical protein n=1 Tax=Streptomyces sp. NRRL S-87 TaxID=1463920 RepID=UPI000ABDBB8B|nr:hypothetical protein [Streptomyces sp. NRRL S-87]